MSETRPKRRFIPPLDQQMQWIVIFAVVGMLALLWIYSAVAYKRLDWLLISGWMSLILAIIFVQKIPQKLEQTLCRLVNRGVLAASEERIEDLQEELEDRLVRYWALAVGGFSALAIAVAFFWAFSLEQLGARIPLFVAEVIGGYVAGCYLGRMACYGTLGFLLRRRNLQLKLMPGHIDGVAGWKPIGDFFFFQAMVVGIPASFLAVWLLLIPLPLFYHQYRIWQEPYITLLLFAIALEAMAFVLPLWSFHREMVRQKRTLLLEADQLAPEIAAIQHRLIETHESEARSALKAQYMDLTAYAKSIEELSVWPVGARTKKLFGLNNIALLIPLLSQYSGMSKHWAYFLQQALRGVGD